MARTTDGAVRRAPAEISAGEMDPVTADTARQSIAAFSVPLLMLCRSRVLNGRRRSRGRLETRPPGRGSREKTFAEQGTWRPQIRRLCWRTARYREEDRET